tara:strand:- start:118 stop:426 length:309 start_codon:yes stop_codon:yes gene_type:complete
LPAAFCLFVLKIGVLINSALANRFVRMMCASLCVVAVSLSRLFSLLFSYLLFSSLRCPQAVRKGMYTPFISLDIAYNDGLDFPLSHEGIGRFSIDLDAGWVN